MFLMFFYSCKKNTNKNNANQNVSKFNYNHVKPNKGVLKGVIELGTSGFNLFIIEVDSNKNWELKQVSYGKSLISEGMTTPDQIFQNLKKNIKKIIEFGVDNENIYTVISSGAIKDELTKSIADKLKEQKHQFEVVSLKEESVYGLKAILPQNFYKNSFVVDIGSGNTKISYALGDDFKTAETFGSKYHQKGTNDKEVSKKVKELAVSIPKEKREYCFIMGGLPYKLAKPLRNKEERHTQLLTNIDGYSKLVEEKGRAMSSGLNIYKSILEETKCKKVLFDWHANFAIGYLLEK